MSGIRRLEVAEITKSGVTGKALVSAVGKMNATKPPVAATKAKKKK